MSGKTTNQEIFMRAILKIKRVGKPHAFFENLNFGDMAVFGTMRQMTDEGAEDSLIKTSSISNKLKISKPALTQIINRLEEKGLIQRVYSKKDRRCTFLQLTEKGTKAFNDEENNMKLMLKTVEEKMGTADFLKLAELVEKFSDVMIEIKEEK